MLFFLSSTISQPPALSQVFPRVWKCVQAVTVFSFVLFDHFMFPLHFPVPAHVFTFSVQLLLVNSHYHHISKASIHFSSPSSIVQVSQPYNATDQMHVQRIISHNSSFRFLIVIVSNACFSLNALFPFTPVSSKYHDYLLKCKTFQSALFFPNTTTSYTTDLVVH